jgi:hypothetical protein
LAEYLSRYAPYAFGAAVVAGSGTDYIVLSLQNEEEIMFSPLDKHFRLKNFLPRSDKSADYG